jgi:hypothetical protein
MSEIKRSLDPKPRRRPLARIFPGTVGRKNRRDIQTLAYRVRDLEAQISAALPILSRESARRSDNQAVHQVTARRYRQFLDQDLIGALRSNDVHIRSESGTDQPRWAAETARDICACLFALPIVAGEGLYSLLGSPGADEKIVADLAATATQLRSAIAFAAASPWSFAYVEGARLDFGYQEPWRDCEPNAPARWVVAPAYVAEGRVIVKQRVYTHQ